MRKLISIIWEVVSYFIIKAVLIFCWLGMALMFVVLPVAIVLLTLFLFITGKGSLWMIVLIAMFGVGMYYFIIKKNVLSVFFVNFKSITPLSERIIAVKSGESDIFERIKKDFEPKEYFRVPFETFEPGGIASLESDDVILRLMNEYYLNNDNKIKCQILPKLKGVIDIYISHNSINNDYVLSSDGERGQVTEYLVELIELNGKKYIPIYTKSLIDKHTPFNSSVMKLNEKGFFCEFNFDKLTKIMFVNFGAREYEFINGRKRDDVVDGIIINPNTDNFIIETEIIRPLVRNPIVLNAWRAKK